MSTPLEGIRVVELASFVAVPAAGALLADLGAEVIKVEVPRGELYRRSTPRTAGFRSSTFSEAPHFQMDNRGKRSLAMDISQEPAQRALRALIRSADIFTSNMLPARLARHGFDPATLRAEQPALICGLLSGFGRAGEDQDRPAFDYTAYWASTGFMDMAHDEGGEPVAQRPGIGDHAACLALCTGLLAALRTRDRTGEGQVVEVSLMHTGLYVLGNDVAHTLVTGETPRRHDRRRPTNPLWNQYTCKDGRSISLVMIESDRYWPQLCEALGRPELAAEERFGDPVQRFRNGKDLVQILDGVFAQHTLAEWEQRFQAHRLIWAPVRTIAEAVRSQQARDAGCFASVDHPTAGRFETVRPPLQMSRHELPGNRPAPALGADSRDVLREVGLSEEQIDAALAAPPDA